MLDQAKGPYGAVLCLSRVSNLKKKPDPIWLFLPSYTALPCWPEYFYVDTFIENISKGDFSMISGTPKSSQVTEVFLLHTETSTKSFPSSRN